MDRLHALMIGVEPDLTFVIDIPPETGLARAAARSDGEQRFEGMGLAMQEAMRAGFLALARDFPERVRIIDGDRAPEAVAAEIAARLA